LKTTIISQNRPQQTFIGSLHWKSSLAKELSKQPEVRVSEQVFLIAGFASFDARNSVLSTDVVFVSGTSNPPLFLSDREPSGSGSAFPKSRFCV
jgi:hypothetical protein